MKDNLPHQHENGTVHTHDNAYPGHTHEHSHEHRHLDGTVHAHPHAHDGSDLDHEHEHTQARDDAAT